MPLTIHVKASNITSLTDARYFAAREVSWLGFCFDPQNSAYIAPSAVKAMKEWVEGPQLVGEFGAQDTDEILGIAAAIGLDAVQVSANLSPADFEKLAEYVVIVHLSMANITTSEALQTIINAKKDVAAGYLFDFGEMSWQAISNGAIGFAVLENIFHTHKCFLHCALEPNDLPQILKLLHPYCLELRGSAEEKVGIKSFDEMDELLDALEV
jgi:phosphoribosylanthranilate isomerase